MIDAHILFISCGYPTARRPYFTFVDQLVCAMADLGVKCSVIAPQSITHSLIRREWLNPLYRQRITPAGNSISVYQPLTISISNYKILNFSANKFFYDSAVLRTLKKLTPKPSVIYGHFWKPALSAYPYAKKNDIPLFAATGESKIGLKNNNSYLDGFSKYLKGVICVSSKNKKESLDMKLTTEDKCIVLPNSIDSNKFYKKDKALLRKKFGYTQEDFIVAFVGGFIHRKGSKRVSDAMALLNDSEIKSIFIGDILGDDRHPPDCNGILFKGRVAHHEVSDYLNCADVFVLPTLKEGCCNAIIEAMACGLPIISSDRDFNDDILNEKNSIRIDPLDISAIAAGIKRVKENPHLRQSMSAESLKLAAELKIEKRAEKILSFITDRI